MRHLLLINPNTSTRDHAASGADAAAAGCPKDVQLALRTATFGARYIACEASHAVAGAAVLQSWAEQLAECGQAAPLDGVLIGCFGDPGLFALRESSACPVTGLAEASFIEAARRGPFAIVTGGAALEADAAAAGR